MRHTKDISHTAKDMKPIKNQTHIEEAQGNERRPQEGKKTAYSEGRKWFDIYLTNQTLDKTPTLHLGTAGNGSVDASRDVSRTFVICGSKYEIIVPH